MQLVLPESLTVHAGGTFGSNKSPFSLCSPYLHLRRHGVRCSSITQR